MVFIENELYRIMSTFGCTRNQVETGTDYNGFGPAGERLLVLHTGSALRRQIPDCGATFKHSGVSFFLV